MAYTSEEVKSWSREKLEEEFIEYDHLYVMQSKRMDVVTKLWRRETGNHHISPDLGDVLEFLIKKIPCSDDCLNGMNGNLSHDSGCIHSEDITDTRDIKTKIDIKQCEGLRYIGIIFPGLQNKPELLRCENDSVVVAEKIPYPSKRKTVALCSTCLIQLIKQLGSEFRFTAVEDWKED